ncbi:MAG: MarR family transcriptional regulator [Alphaproteobacteria bacterium]|nr:MarR family transcriptional regulator [Alphaproteobacteria bacterium]
MKPSDFNASQLLVLWHRVVLNTLHARGPDLSTRQLGVLLTVYMIEENHTVRGLAQELKISKPAITRALDRLCELGLLRRKADDRDRRSVLIQRTVKGSVFLSEFSGAIVEAASDLAGAVPR